MEDRGCHQEPAYHVHKEASEVAFPSWPPNQGNGPIENNKKTKKSFEKEVSSRAGLPTFHIFPVNDIVVYLITKRAQWPPS